jgi:hypothetical protein
MTPFGVPFESAVIFGIILLVLSLVLASRVEEGEKTTDEDRSTGGERG